ncbi:23S rRNA pseudouridine(2605) synthase RluB [Endozoicomonas sp. GU-1]|uniref:23S rRNA pseudouridine(2605) synthase RluB n=1 Tax=Endozoicomonas sp. GU-1 TaxID=3009078 RepID=UPI0022B43884|nr:pseudouridine synthase [Endozoicomonas sp. GU-1]WBA83513.1 pseudouridine synthase [Endozoicomonas sp. GU-1]WBA86447.1 pseudouridine synthase [Endozoicomonas sp. GU-1]
MTTETTLPPQGEKLQKILAGAGLGSRREMERWITEGRISVNGVKASLGDRAALADVIAVDGRVIKLDAYASGIRRVIAYNKPEGEICSRSDQEGRPTVFDKLPKLKGERWISIGRLDLNTSGLLLFTNDGELASRLMHPSHSIEREYAVRVMGDITQQKVKNLFEGVELEDGMARFTDIVDSGGTGINHWFHVCILEGRNREVRRLWESQDLKVSRLKRVRFGSMIIPDHLRQGQFQELEKQDIDALAALVDLSPAPAFHKKPQDRLKKNEVQARKVKGSTKRFSPHPKKRSR